MVYSKVLCHPNFGIEGQASSSLCGCMQVSRSCPVAGQAKQTALAQVLIMTDVLFRSIDPHQIPAELKLIIDFDLPLRKVA